MNDKTKKELLDVAEEFLRELGRGLPPEERVMAGYAEEATVQTDATGKKINGGWWPVPYSNGKYIDQNKNCYVCISSSIKTPNPKTGAMRYWRGEASFGHGLALMVDDIGAGKGSKGDFALEAMCKVLQPTAIVETSPGNYQLWYFLEEPENDMRRFKAFLNSFVTNVLKKGGDNTIKDVARYGRMPCGINNKRTSEGQLKYPVGVDKRGAIQPWTVQVMHTDYRRRYSIDSIARAFAFEIVLPVYDKTNLDDKVALQDQLKWDYHYLKEAERILSKAKAGEGSNGDVVVNMSGKYRIRCPWGHQHTNGDPFGAYFRGPIPGADVDFVFGCAHDACRKDHKRGWNEFVDEVVMPQVMASLDEVNKEWL